jgi:hypothetical protein
MNPFHFTRGRSLFPAAALLITGVVLGGAAGCGNGDGSELGASSSSPGSAGPGYSGSISFALTTPQGFTFNSFSYAIVGPNFTKAAAIDVSHSTTVSALIDDIPPGPGYTMTLSGDAAPPNQATCSGSSPFTVAAGSVTEVSVSLACHVTEPAPAVPIPPYAPVALGVILFALGTFAMGRRHEPA